VRDAGIVENPLGGGRLSGVNMGGNSDIANSL